MELGGQFDTVTETEQGVRVHQFTFLRKGVSVEDATPELIQEMLDEAERKPCPDCGVEVLLHYDYKPAEGRCGKCWGKRCDALNQQEMAEERKKAARFRARKKAQGFTHLTIAWVHAGGDDVAIEIYTKGAPKTGEIETILRRRRSRVLDDYKTTAL